MRSQSLCESEISSFTVHHSSTGRVILCTCTYVHVLSSIYTSPVPSYMAYGKVLAEI